jgi:hypothetical protein
MTRPEESYRLWCVTVCDLETSRLRRLKPASGLQKPVEKEDWVAQISDSCILDCQAVSTDEVTNISKALRPFKASVNYLPVDTA